LPSLLFPFYPSFFSDHLGIRCFFYSSLSSVSFSSISRSVSDSPSFAFEIRRRWNRISIPSSPFKALKVLKEIFLASAKFVKKRVRDLESPFSSFSLALRLSNLISSFAQDFIAISSFLSRFSSFASLVSFSGSRWVDSGLAVFLAEKA
jgi:hypothetical protein